MPPALSTLPPRPEMAPEKPSDVELAAERLRFGGAIVVLENMVKGLIRWGNEK